MTSGRIFRGHFFYSCHPVLQFSCHPALTVTAARRSTSGDWRNDMPTIKRRAIAAILFLAIASALFHGRGLMTSENVFVLSGEPVPESNTPLRTRSLALDRIAKREPTLDSTMRRAGSGAGTIIYVFDGGVNPGHPELDGRVRIGYNAFPENSE